MLERIRMPAEWEPHEGTWLAWPHEKTDWPGKFAPIPWVYGEIVRQLARVERVHILVKDEDAEQQARRLSEVRGVDMEAVDFFRCPTDRSWTRDYCPHLRPRRSGANRSTCDWQFNGWAKYRRTGKRDDAVPSFVAAKLKCAMYSRSGTPGIVLEGGSIDVNGARRRC